MWLWYMVSCSPDSGLFNFDLHHCTPTLPLPTYLPPADDGVIIKLGRPAKKTGEHNYEFVDNAIFDGLNQVCREIIKDRADSGLG